MLETSFVVNVISWLRNAGEEQRENRFFVDKFGMNLLFSHIENCKKTKIIEKQKNKQTKIIKKQKQKND